jgi:hypothetical protein
VFYQHVLGEATGRRVSVVAERTLEIASDERLVVKLLHVNKILEFTQIRLLAKAAFELLLFFEFCIALETNFDAANFFDKHRFFTLMSSCVLQITTTSSFTDSMSIAEPMCLPMIPPFMGIALEEQVAQLALKLAIQVDQTMGYN